MNNITGTLYRVSSTGNLKTTRSGQSGKKLVLRHHQLKSHIFRRLLF